MSIDYAELLNCKVCIISVFGSENLSMANIRKKQFVYVIIRVQNYDASPISL